MTREERLESCKVLARPYLHAGNLADAVSVFMIEMNRHKDTEIPTQGALADLTMFALVAAGRGDFDFVERYIEGFR